MSTESYTKASADFNKWVRESLRLDLSPAGIAAIIVQHGAAMRAAFSENAETASTLKAAQLEIKTLRNSLDDAERRAIRAEADLAIFQGSVNDSHAFLNEYLGTPESHEHGPVTSRIKTLLEAKDKLAAGQDKRIVELEAKVAKLDADTAIDLQVYALSQADKMRLKMLEHAFRNVDELLTKHGVSRDGYVTQKIERLIAGKDRLLAEKDKQIAAANAEIADRKSQYVAAANELTLCKGELQCYISSPDVDTSDLQAMIKHVKWIISETHDAIRAAGLAFVDICGTQIIVNHVLPADRIRELVSETLAKAKERREEASEDLDSLKQQGAAWSEVVDQVSAGNPRLWDSSLSGKLIVINEIKRLQTEAAKPKVMAVDFETYRDPLRVAYETSPSGAAAATSIAADNQLETQKRETAKWKRAARAHASGLASIKRVLDFIAPIGSPAVSGSPASASLVDRIRGLEKHGIKTLAARERFIEMLKGSIEEAHAVLDKSKFLTPRSTSHRSLRERVGVLVAWSNLFV